MNLILRTWHRSGPEDKDAIHEYQVKGISGGSSFLEMLSILSEEPFARGGEPIALDSDCHEDICGQCGIVIDGIAHGLEITTTYQLHMRSFSDDDVIAIEPWRASGFPIIKDLAVNRSALDRIIQAGGYISVDTGAAPNAHATPVLKQDADHTFEAVACVGRGACVAACPNASTMFFTSAKVTHLGLLPRDKPENYKHVINMLNQMDEEGFGSCSNIGEYAEVCPKQIPLDVVANPNRQLGKAAFGGV